MRILDVRVVLLHPKWMQGGLGVWHETGRYRVRDEKGVLSFVVEMTREIDAKPIIGKQRRVPHQKFYFLLEGQDVRPASDDAFVNLDTGEVLVRVVE